MSLDPYFSEIKIFSFDWAPRGWAQCNGQIMQISTNQALFSLLGTTYGGNGQTTFALPNLQGRNAIHFGTGAGLPTFTLGQVGGTEGHTLIASELPQHNHFAFSSLAVANETYPAPTNLWAAGATAQGYAPAANAAMAGGAIANAGGGQPHENRSPYLVLNICISLQGVFPSRN